MQIEPSVHAPHCVTSNKHDQRKTLINAELNTVLFGPIMERISLQPQIHTERIAWSSTSIRFEK
jgi:hypothetical protein